nr:hypothetical protein [uncultured Albidiferax sp.]
MKVNLPKVRSLWLPVLILLSACSQSPEDRLVELGRCYKAGAILKDRVLLRGVEITSEKTIRDSKIEVSPAMFAMLINEKINDELYSEGSSTDPARVLKTLTKWANSSVCKDMKQQGVDAGEP